MNSTTELIPLHLIVIQTQPHKLWYVWLLRDTGHMQVGGQCHLSSHMSAPEHWAQPGIAPGPQLPSQPCQIFCLNQEDLRAL